MTEDGGRTGKALIILTSDVCHLTSSRVARMERSGMRGGVAKDPGLRAEPVIGRRFAPTRWRFIRATN